MPNQIPNFLHQFFSHGSSVDKGLLTKFELDRIHIDGHNTLYNVSQELKDFLRLYFVFGKGLLLSVLLSEDGFGAKLDSSSIVNLKIIASILYYAMIDNCTLLVPSMNEYKDTEEEPYEPISKLVFTDEQLAYMFIHHPEFYHEDLKSKIMEWIKQLDKLIKSTVDK